MIHRFFGRFPVVAASLALAACASSTAPEEASQAPAASKPVGKPETASVSAPVPVDRTAAGYDGIRPPKDLLSLPKDREMQATNPTAGTPPAPGGVIVNPTGPKQ